MKRLLALGALALLCGCRSPAATSGDGNSAVNANGGIEHSGTVPPAHGPGEGSDGGTGAILRVQSNRAVVVGLSPTSPSPGPVNVRAYAGERLMGSWIVRVGDPPVVIGVPGAGFVTLRWIWPDGRPAERKVKVRNDPVRVWLDKD